MDTQTLYDLISKIAMMGGDPLDEVLAPSEIRLIAYVVAEAVAQQTRVDAPAAASHSEFDFLFQEAPFEGVPAIGASGFC